MSWRCEQSTGKLYRPDGTLFHTGYSGNNRAANQSVLQHIQHLGPIPQGNYRMTQFRTTTQGRGPNVVSLTPEPGTETFGRDGFLIHGDNPQGDNSGSTGCIIVNGATLRQAIWNSGDRIVEVVP
ncbi:MAG: DUF2778 domain-containing protein [Azoarcus sp.]|nr:DUF2778 domain-containing protein [Azoarcus sp.]